MDIHFNLKITFNSVIKGSEHWMKKKCKWECKIKYLLLNNNDKLNKQLKDIKLKSKLKK